MSKDFTLIENGYKNAMKWIKANVKCETFTLKWEELYHEKNTIIVIVDTVTVIDWKQQISSVYRLKIVNNEVTLLNR